MRFSHLLILALLLTAKVVSAADLWLVSGRVVAISDGDTITVLDKDKRQHKIRLAGIDAPERQQAFGNVSRENLSRLAFDRFVDARSHKRDRFGREVCAVMHGPTDLSLEQVRAGLAWWYRGYANEQTAGDRAIYENAENNARTQRRGLWQDPKPVPPWDWRRKGPQ